MGKRLSRTRARKLAIWGALPPYLGGKRRLCPLIFREVDRILPRRAWPGRTFLDGFLGGGSVSLYAKAQGFKVVAADIAERSIVVGRALIENNRVRLTRGDVLQLAAPTDDAPGRIEQGYAPRTFTRAQARLLDRALAAADAAPDPAKGALLRLLAIRVALLAHPMSQVRAGTIHRLSSGEFESITESCLYHYVDGLRLGRPEKLWELAQQVNAGPLLDGLHLRLAGGIGQALGRVHRPRGHMRRQAGDAGMAAAVVVTPPRIRSAGEVADLTTAWDEGGVRQTVVAIPP